MNALQNLTFAINVHDLASAPTQRIMNNIMSSTQQIQNSVSKIGIGTAAGVASTYTIDKLISKAVAFESVMADVNKAVDFAEPKHAKAFGNELLKMSRIIPINAVGLGQIATEGGKMGVAQEQLLGYTQTIAKMASALDLLPAQAGHSMAILANIYSRPIEQIGVLGDAINWLADKTAADANGIINVMNRIGGNATMLGINDINAAAYSGAFLSLGKSEEVAGTSLNAFFNKLYTGENQSKEFQAGLDRIGLSSKKMAQMIEANPTTALDDFMGRIIKLNKHDRALTLGNIFGNEFSDDISTAVGSLESFRSTLKLVSNEYNYLGSMEREFIIRSSTTQNQLIFLKNHFDNLLINFGTIYLPLVNHGIELLNNKLASISNKLDRWSRIFPNLTGLFAKFSATIFLIIAGLSIFTIIAGISALALMGLIWTFKTLLSIMVGFGSVTGGGLSTALRVLMFAIAPFFPQLIAIVFLFKILARVFGLSINVVDLLHAGLLRLSQTLGISSRFVWRLNSAFLINPFSMTLIAILDLIKLGLKPVTALFGVLTTGFNTYILAVGFGVGRVFALRMAMRDMWIVMRSLWLIQKLMTAATWLWNVALFANPIVAVIAALVALGIYLGIAEYGFIGFAQQVAGFATSWYSSSGLPEFFSAISAFFDVLPAYLQLKFNQASTVVMAWVVQAGLFWDSFIGVFHEKFDPLTNFIHEMLGGWFDFTPLFAAITTGIAWIMAKFTSLFSWLNINSPIRFLTGVLNTATEGMKSELSINTGTKPLSTKGIANTVNTLANNNSKTVNVGTVNVNNTHNEPLTATHIAEAMRMATQ